MIDGFMQEVEIKEHGDSSESGNDANTLGMKEYPQSMEEYFENNGWNEEIDSPGCRRTGS